MTRWPRFPFDATPYTFTPEALAARWGWLHAADAEPWPESSAVQTAWVLYHAGSFEQAMTAGLVAGPEGWTVASRAQLVQATYLERREAGRSELLREVVERSRQHLALEKDNVGAHVLLCSALMRLGQAQHMSAPQAHELGIKIRQGLQTAIRLRPLHTEAHIMLASHYTDVIDRSGHLMAKAEGADSATIQRLLRQALTLQPSSALARLELARALLVMDGSRRQAEADELLRQAANGLSMDATERLHAERARAELTD